MHVDIAMGGWRELCGGSQRDPSFGDSLSTCSPHTPRDRSVCSSEMESCCISRTLGAVSGALWDFAFLRSRVWSVKLPEGLQQEHTELSRGST